MKWQHNVRQIEKQHIELIKENGELKIRGRKKTGWSINDTARRLGFSTGKVSEDLRLARGLKKHSEINKIEERRDAIAFLKVKGEW